MERINPELRYEFESLPIALKNQILESNVQISTRDELYRMVELLECENRACGDLPLHNAPEGGPY